VAGIGHRNARRRQVYEDIRSDSKAWVSPDFETDKAAGRFPFGRLPLLEVSCALTVSRVIDLFGPIASAALVAGANAF
jgi:hypothetical protein